MNFDLSEEQRILVEMFRKFCRKEIAPLVSEAEEKKAFPTQLFPKMGKLGYLCIGYPADYGAAGMDMVTQCFIIEELGYTNSGICAGILNQSGLATSAILHHGTEEQKQNYLVPVIKGEKIAAIAITEPNAGSDVGAIETKAVKSDGEYVINGNKTFISCANFADFISVLCYTDKSKGQRQGMSLIIVDKDAPGFTVSRILEKLGVRSNELTELAFEDCRTPGRNLIGEEGNGFSYVMESLTGGRILHSSRSIGIARAAFEAALDYAKQRTQFGKPIGKFQMNQAMLANMAMEIDAAWGLTLKAAWLFDQGKKCEKEASMAKLYASEMSKKVTDDALQIFGGYGFMMEYPVQRYMRDSRVNTISEGTSQIQQIVIARELGL